MRGSGPWNPTWKRYCDSVGVSMGRAVTMLIDRELVGVFGDVTGDEPPVFGFSDSRPDSNNLGNDRNPCSRKGFCTWALLGLNQ